MHRLPDKPADGAVPYKMFLFLHKTGTQNDDKQDVKNENRSGGRPEWRRADRCRGYSLRLLAMMVLGHRLNSPHFRQGVDYNVSYAFAFFRIVHQPSFKDTLSGERAGGAWTFRMAATVLNMMEQG